MIQELKRELDKKANSEKAKLLQRFFKTGKGEYGEGDIFLGIMVPIQREVAKKYKELEMNELNELLNSKIHEHRLIALFILVDKYKKASKEKNESEKEKIFEFYLKNAARGNINNWDLIDLSSPNIVGKFIFENRNNKGKRRILYGLAKSKSNNSLWEKRIAMLGCAEFIRNNEFSDTLKIAEILLNDQHDLIHKAVGWMLREIGKRNQDVEEEFLKKHYKTMPRTMLRYAIEKFPEEKRKFYMKKD